MLRLLRSIDYGLPSTKGRIGRDRRGSKVLCRRIASTNLQENRIGSNVGSSDYPTDATAPCTYLHVAFEPDVPVPAAPVRLPHPHPVLPNIE